MWIKESEKESVCFGSKGLYDTWVADVLLHGVLRTCGFAWERHVGTCAVAVAMFCCGRFLIGFRFNFFFF